MILKRLMKFGTTCAIILSTLWLAGFFLFVGRVTAYTEPFIDEEIAATDAIVVLTGGSERLSAGLNLLRAGKAKKLLISGVFPSVTPAEIAKLNDISEELNACCVVLGRAADNTFGNAIETRNFMRQENFRTVRLVTAHYHMPRSLFLFNKMMPNVRIYLYPVSPDSVVLTSWWNSPGTLSLLAFEYCKYLYVRFKYMVLEGWQ